MGKRFKTGARNNVIARMAEHAIRDQVALIDAYTPALRRMPIDSESQAVIDGCRANILDYQRLRAEAIKEQQP